MGAFDFLRTPSAVEDMKYYSAWTEEVAKVDSLNDEVNYLSGEIREVQEDLLKISDAFDNVGWSPLDTKDSREMTLSTVKKIASVARAMNAMNSFVKRGVNARISYVFGRGCTFDGIGAIEDKIKDNRKKLFSPQAYEELERVLATDGNAFTALPNGLKASDADLTAFRISLDEIEGAISNPEDKEEIWYYKRTYATTVTNSATGEQEERSETKWYPSITYFNKLKKQGRNLPRRWGKHGVDQRYVIQHTAVNKQVGWRWGVPDVLPVIYWAKAYKEYLEDNAMLVKAYSRLAWSVKVPNSGAGAQASAQVMKAPTRDPMTGEMSNVGGTAVGTHEVTALPATGSGVNFDNGSAMASAIAAGLEVSKVVILSDSGASNRAAEQGLDLPTLKAMQSRQAVHVERFTEIFEFWGATVDLNLSSLNDSGSTPGTEKKSTPFKKHIEESAGERPEPPEYVVIIFPSIEAQSDKDRATTLGTLVELGVLYKSEVRRDILDSLNIIPSAPWWELPTMEDDPKAQEEQEHSDENARLAFERQQESNAARTPENGSVVAAQGKSGGVSAKGGAQSTNNQARDARAADSKKK